MTEELLRLTPQNVSCLVLRRMGGCEKQETELTLTPTRVTYVGLVSVEGESQSGMLKPGMFRQWLAQNLEGFGIPWSTDLKWTPLSLK